MNFKNLVFTTLASGVLFSTFSQNNIARGESHKNQTINYQESIAPDSNLFGDRSITHILIGGRIITQFSPRNSQGEKIELQQLATKLGYDHFNWVSYVETDPHGIVDSSGVPLSTPYNDPPQGGYRYDSADRFPFYWDVVDCDRCKQRHHVKNYNNSQPFDLVFEDAPADYRLQPGEAIEFITNLVGVKKLDKEQNQTEWEVIHTFRWKLTYPTSHQSQVSIIDDNVLLNKISPQLLNMMVLDGAILPTSVEVSNSL